MTQEPDRNARTKPSARRGGAVGLGWALGTLVAVVGIGFLALRTEVGQTLFGGWSFVKSVEQDQGTYYRLKVKLTYKGEPQDFDIVVGCNVRRITYKDGSGTYEPGLIPDVFGRRMSDGKGLVVRPPNACGGETTANGKVQPDLLPIVVVYDNANTLDFGTAYLSEDAYDSPISVLKFGGAIIEPSNRSEFDQFRQAESNLVTRALYHSTFGDDVKLKVPHVAGSWAHVCEGYNRFQIPDELRERIHHYWPGSHPEFWIADTYDAENDIGVPLMNSKFVQIGERSDSKHSFGAFGSLPEHEADFGMPTRAGGGLISAMRGQRYPAASYPAASDYRRDQWPLKDDDWPSYVATHSKFAEVVVEYRAGATKGFAYCWARSRAWNPEFLKTIGSRRALASVDQAYATTTRADYSQPLWIFQRDDYVFRFFRIYLETTRGDV